MCRLASETRCSVLHLSNKRGFEQILRLIAGSPNDFDTCLKRMQEEDSEEAREMERRRREGKF